MAVLLAGNLALLRTDTIALSDEDVSATALAEYEWFSGNIGTTVSAEYLPQGVAPRPFSSGWLLSGTRDQAAVTAGAAQVTQVVRRTARQTWTLAVGEAGATVVLPLLAWPGWEASLADGLQLPLAAAAGSGLAQLVLPAGTQTLTLQLARTPWRLTGELLAAAALLLLLILLAPALRLPSLRRGAAWSGAALVALLCGGLLPSRPLPDAARSWDFAQQAYLHRAPDGIRFAGGYVLRSYTLPEQPLQAGQTVRLRLEWETAPPFVELSLQQPGAVRFPAAPPVIEPHVAAGAPQQVIEITLPDAPPAGLLLPRLRLLDENGFLLPALTAAGEPRGDLFLAPLRVALPAPQSSTGPDLDVALRAVTQPAAEQLEIALAWRSARALSRDYSVSLRLVDAAGAQLAQFDSQPGYGFLPSSGWPAGVWIEDRLALPLPAELDAPQPYALVVRLYESGGAVVLTRRLGELTGSGADLAFRPTVPRYDLPDDLTRVDVNFGGAITLAGYRLTQAGGSVDLTLFWQAAHDGLDDYAHFVHLVDPASGAILTQNDAQPRANSYPTSQWRAGEVVDDPLRLDLSGIAAGRYELRVGLYRPADPQLARLSAGSAGGAAVADDSLVIPLTIPAP